VKRKKKMLKGILIGIVCVILAGFAGNAWNEANQNNPLTTGQVSSSLNMLHGNNFEQAITNNGN
jgi:hypothetical protein